MPQFVLMVGMLISVISLYLMLQPERLGKLSDRVFGSRWLYGAALLRLLLGAGLIASAPTVAMPGIVRAFGWLFVLGGLGLVAIPQPPLQRIAGWFGSLPSLATRMWLSLSLLFGLFFVYAAAA